MTKKELQLKRMTEVNTAERMTKEETKLKRMTKVNMAKDDQRKDAVKKDDQS